MSPKSLRSRADPDPCCCGLSCVPQNSYVEILTPATYECDAFGDEAFKEVIKLKRAHEDEPSSNMTAVLLTRAEQTQMCTEGCVQRNVYRGHREDGRLHAKERGLRGNQPCGALIWDLQPPELDGNTFPWFQPPWSASRPSPS